jgi:hypothetical protein
MPRRPQERQPLCDLLALRTAEIQPLSPGIYRPGAISVACVAASQKARDSPPTRCLLRPSWWEKGNVEVGRYKVAGGWPPNRHSCRRNLTCAGIYAGRAPRRNSLQALRMGTYRISRDWASSPPGSENLLGIACVEEPRGRAAPLHRTLPPPGPLFRWRGTIAGHSRAN